MNESTKRSRRLCSKSIKWSGSYNTTLRLGPLDGYDIIVHRIAERTRPHERIYAVTIHADGLHRCVSVSSIRMARYVAEFIVDTALLYGRAPSLTKEHKAIYFSDNRCFLLDFGVGGDDNIVCWFDPTER